MYLDRLTGHKRRRSHPRGDASCAVRRLLETPGTSPPTCRDWSYPRPHLGNLGARTDVHFGDGLRDLALLPGSNCQEGRRVDNSGTPRQSGWRGSAVATHQPQLATVPEAHVDTASPVMFFAAHPSGRSGLPRQPGCGEPGVKRTPRESRTPRDSGRAPPQP